MVLLSGGLDSATTLAIAKEQGFQCYALSFSYGQRHLAELQAARKIAESIGVVAHQIAEVDMGFIGGSALTDNSIDVPEQPTEGIPVTYVPARNTIFLSLALAWAEVLAARDIFIGVNAVDYSGYPDCRPEYIDAYEHMANLATAAGVSGRLIHIQAPLINLSKQQIIEWGSRLQVDYQLTISCYASDSEGRACGRCDSCRLRRTGFQAAGLPDPTIYA